MHHSWLISLLSAAAITSALPVEERQAGPAVTIKNGTVIGSSAGGVDSFKGIPFAQPPVGNLRLRAPQSINASFGTITATGIPRSCPQQTTQINTTLLPQDIATQLQDSPALQAPTDAGEDCLTLNVQRPSTATSSSKLPVVFWIFGGGFEAGSTQTYDGTSLIQRSITQNESVIYVAVNYRLNGFGFLAGKELAAEGSTNLGLRDQRKGLEWVAENIAAFGGDPSKVTIWGESAGSISVFDQTAINGGDNTYKGKSLFRGAIMDSGSITPADPVTAPQAQAVFNTVLTNAGCGGKTGEAALQCLRSVSYETFQNAVNSNPGIFSYRSVDLAYLPRPDPGNKFFSQSPEVALAAGKFAKVPIIIGDQQDEGPLFSLSQSNITTNDQLIQYVASYFPGNKNAVADVTALVSNYPDQPLLGQPAGSPFNTGSLNNVYPEYKRLAAILGDIVFTLTRRTYLSIVSSQVPSYSYLATYLFGTPVLGTFHASDIVFAYGLAGPTQIPTITIQTYYINFINHLNPNTGGTPAPLITWPQYSTSAPSLVDFGIAGNTIIQDDFRQGAAQYLASHPSSFRV